MVSNARPDLPLPLGPVITVNFPNGRSRSMPLRLFCRAPRISTHPALIGAVTRSCSIALEVTEDIPRRRRNSQGKRLVLEGLRGKMYCRFFSSQVCRGQSNSLRATRWLNTLNNKSSPFQEKCFDAE